MEELALDEGGTNYSSLYRTFPIGRFFSYAQTKTLRIWMVDRARNLNRNQLEMGPKDTLESERFSVAVLALYGFWTMEDFVV